MNVHAYILNKINDTYKGVYRNVPVRIQGSQAVLPNHLRVPEEMDAFYKEMESNATMSPPEQAILAHYEIVRIHPFIDGNGRTARLVANYILMKYGYAPALVRKEERATYIEAVSEYNLFGRPEKYYRYMYRAIERGLDEYLKLLENPPQDTSNKLLKIGELALLAGVSTASVRYWTKEGLLVVQDYTKGGYQLYDGSMVARINRIRALQEKGLSLDRIKYTILT